MHMTTPTDSGIVTDEGLVERVAIAIRDLSQGEGFDYMDFCRDAARAAIEATGILALTRTLADERKRIGELRERLRVLMIKQPISGERNTYPDGFGQGLCYAIGEIDKMNASLSQRPTDGEG